MLTIIEIKDREDGGHGLQSQSHRTECWLEGWLAVPPELEQTAWDCAGYCDLDIQDGKLVGPLNIIYGYVELAKDTRDRKRRNHHLENIETHHLQA